jgi:hypothetical protein
MQLKRADGVRRASPGLSVKMCAVTAVGLLTAGVLVACGGGSSDPGVASIGTSTSSSPGPSGHGPTTPLEYARCMRAHGLPDFPDPDSDGNINLTATAGTDPNSPQWKAATKACGQLPPPASSGNAQEQYALALKFAQCMRAHGQPLSDPQPPGSGPQVQSQNGGSANGAPSGQNGNLDPNSPQFKAAQEACQKVAPGLEGMGLHSEQGQ